MSNKEIEERLTLIEGQLAELRAIIGKTIELVERAIDYSDYPGKDFAAKVQYIDIPKYAERDYEI